MVIAAVIALAVSGVAAVAAAIALYGQSDWLFREFTKNNPKPGKKNHLTVAELHDKVPQAQRTALIGALIVVLAVAILGYTTYRGRYWARWGVLGFWVLATFSGTVIGINSILTVAANIPAAYKIPSFIAGVAFAVAVVLVNLKESTEYFALSRPVRPAGAPQRRGLFGGPRMAPQPRGAAAGSAGRGATASTRPASTEPDADRRTKKRATVAAQSASVTKGAELARSRAKASKSRRPPTDR